MAPKIVDKDAKRAQILRAALRILGQRGVSHLKMDDIAAAAAVGKGTLYTYFPSKQDLIGGAFGFLLEEFQQFVEARTDMSAAPGRKLSQYIRNSLEFCTHNKELLDALFDFYAAGVPRKDGRPPTIEMSTQYRQSRRWLAGVIDEGIRAGEFRSVDSEAAAGIIIATIDGLLYQAVVGVVSLHDSNLRNNLELLLTSGLVAKGK
jgi:TetR/AcrR family fatty acid metabolism transcriptional regulator